MARPARPLDADRFRLLDQLSKRLAAGHVDDDVRRAVSLLTADAAPERADRLAIRPREPVVLVERLAVWALHRASTEAVDAAARLLRQPDASATDRSPETATTARPPRDAQIAVLDRDPVATWAVALPR